MNDNYELDVAIERFLRLFLDRVPAGRTSPDLAELAQCLLDQIEARNDAAEADDETPAGGAAGS